MRRANPAPPQVLREGAQPRAGGLGTGHTITGPARSGGVGIPGRPAPAGVRALEVDALGGRRAVVLQAVCALVPVCGRGRDRTRAGEKTSRGCSSRAPWWQLPADQSPCSERQGVEQGVGEALGIQHLGLAVGFPAQSPPCSSSLGQGDKPKARPCPPPAPAG